MTTIDPKIEERMPVWRALSELFLDTQLQRSDFDRIAEILAASRYSEEELEEILCFEVTPALSGNLLSIAGEWAGFSDEWLLEKIGPRIDKKRRFRFGLFSMIRRPWKEIRGSVATRRKT